MAIMFVQGSTDDNDVSTALLFKNDVKKVIYFTVIKIEDLLCGYAPMNGNHMAPLKVPNGRNRMEQL